MVPAQGSILAGIDRSRRIIDEAVDPEEHDPA